MTDNFTKFTLDKLQLEHKPWELKNFGEHPAWHPLLGIVEEIGELEEALYADHKNNEIIKDALGDIIIYLVDFCNICHYNLGEIVTTSKFKDNEKPRIITVVLGRIAHSFLKDTQGIRGTHEEHQKNIQELIGELWYALKSECQPFSKNLVEIVEETWNKVKNRDWTKNKTTGQAVVNTLCVEPPTYNPVYKYNYLYKGKVIGHIYAPNEDQAMELGKKQFLNLSNTSVQLVGKETL